MIDASLIVNIIASTAAILAVVTALYIHWDSSAPDIQVYLDSDVDKGCTSLVVMNYGKKPAYDVKIHDFDFGLVQPSLASKVEGSFVAKGIPMLAPGKTRTTIITENKYASEHFQDISVRGKVAYRKKSFFGQREVQSSYTLDYYSFANSLYVPSDIHEMKQALESISDSIGKILAKGSNH